VRLILPEKKMKLIYLIMIICLTNITAWGQLQIDTPALAEVIDFDGFLGTGFSPTPDPGQLSSESWEVIGMSDGNLLFGDTQIAGDFARGASAGGVTTGGCYSFDNGTGASLGFQATTADFTPGSFTLKILNNTGATMNQITLDYEVWVRNDQNRSTSFNFSHSDDNVNYTSVPSLDFVSVEAADASPVWEMNARSIVISGVSISDQEVYYLRWTSNDVSGSGSRDELALDNIGVSLAFVVMPEITATPLSLSGFEQTLPSFSAEQTMELSGTNLDGDIDLTVSGDFEISLSSGTGFAATLTLTATAGELAPTVVYVRLNGTATGSVNEVITASSLNATNVVVTLSGEIVPEPTPAISVSSAVLSGFTQTLGAPSSTQSVEVSGLNLQEDLELSVSGDFEISLDELTGFSNAITLSQTSGTVASTLVYVRLNGTVAAVLVEESITIVSTGAATEVVELAGEILEPVTPEITASTPLIDGFLQLVGTPSASESFTVSAENLEEDLLVTVSGEYEISLDENSGYVTALTIPESNGSIPSTTLYVRLNGAAPQDPSNGVVSMISQNAASVFIDLEGAIIACNVDVSTSLNELIITANAPGMTYSWIDCENNNAVIPGQTGQSFTATENGAYAVIVSDGLCSDTSECVVISTVGIGEELLNKIHVFPNPIVYEFMIVGAPIGAEVELIAVSGQLVYQGSITSVSECISTNELQSGVYILVVRENGQQSQFRLVK
jgi:hypothetical protein